MSKTNFKASLNIGTQGEKFSRKMLESLGFKTEDGDGKIVDFWLIVGKKKYSCEVKFDVYANKSGNYAIETYNTKLCKPSGIMSTTCDLWFHALSENVIHFCICTDLKDFTEKTKPKKLIISGGDSNANLSLYAAENICGICLLELNKENLDELITKVDSRMSLSK